MIRRFRLAARPLARRARLWLQSLEDRTVPTTYTVNTTTDTASGAGTSGALRYLIGQANGNAGSDSIVFDTSVFSSASTITLNSALGQLSVTDTLNITGPGSSIVTVSGGGKVRVFDVDGTSSSASFTLKYITVTAGKVSSIGGAGIRIHSGASASLNLSAVTASVATSSDGGGTQLVGSGTLYIDACTFSDNSAMDGYGGAIAVSSSGTLQIYNSGFNDNAADFGGGVAIRDSGNAILSNDTVTLNDASTDGGGVFAEGTAKDLQSVRVIDCEFTENSALYGNGGGFFGSYFVDDSFSSSTLSKNRAMATTPAANKGSGGGIFVHESDLTISKCTIEGNGVDVSGGGVFAQFGTLVIADSTISGNTFGFQGSGGNGGGTGGGVSAYKCDTALDGCLVTGNSSYNPTLKSPDWGNGGGVASAEADLTLTDCTVTLNHAGFGSAGAYGSGGGVFFNGATANYLTISGCTIGQTTKVDEGNSAEVYGGGVYASLGIVDITDSLVEDNNADNGGGLYLDNVADATLSGDTIIVNSATYGGGVRINAGVDVEVFECAISSNSATAGGGISVLDPNGSLTIDRTTINSNTSSAEGAGIAYANSSDSVPLTIIDTTVSRNVAGGNGGGLHLVGSRSPRVQNSTIALNEAVGGGGVYFAGSDGDDEPEFFNTTIAGNKATGDSIAVPAVEAFGGGLFLASFTGSNDVLTLDSTIVAKNVLGNTTNKLGPDIYGDDSVTFAQVREVFSILGVGDSANFKLVSSSNNNNGTKASPLDPGLSVSGGTLVLTNNGGPTETIALIKSSVAINKGRNFLSLNYDQRGAPYNRVVGKNADVGAYERVSKDDDDGGKFSFGGGGGIDDGEPIPPAAVLEVTINEDYDGPGGTGQRSAVVSVTVRFSDGVELPWDGHPESAFRLSRQSDGATPSLIAADLSTDGDNSVVRLTFTGATAIDGSSLADGRYTLTIFASKVSGGYFDGNGDGDARDNYVLVGHPSGPGLFRFFGDYTGDGIVDGFDFAVFRTIYAPGHDDDADYDFGGTGWDGLTEYAAFAVRYGTSI